MAEPTHAYLAPSSASRWSICTASPGFIERNNCPNESSEYADEGTRAHAYASYLLDPTHQKVAKPDNDEMHRIVMDYAAYVRSQREPEDLAIFERRVPLFYFPKQKGTVDVGLFGPTRAHVIDLKYGAGVGVYPERNKQLVTYAESVLREIELSDQTFFPADMPVRLTIYQPRDRNDSEAIRTWETSRGELAFFARSEIESAAKAILADPHSPTLQFVPTDNGCRFCPAKGICSAYGTQGLSVITDEPIDEAIAGDTLDILPSPQALTREQRVRVIAGRKRLEQWLEAVEDQEMAELLAGAAPITFKLVEGKSNRRWTDESAAQKLLRNYLKAEETNPPAALISPAQAEGLLKAHTTSTKFDNRLAALIEKPQGKPSLVPITDKRLALNMNPLEGLSDMDEDLI